MYVECLGIKRNLNVYELCVEYVEMVRRHCYVNIYVECLRMERKLGMCKLCVKCVCWEM